MQKPKKQMLQKSKAKGAAFELILKLNKEEKLNYKKILGNNTKHNRSSVEFKESEKELIIKITAKDATALRASTNSILRDLQVIESTKIN
jgi:tRNA threonylcarbamoyladenosine modification (KEOPS) complex  Pcc1 subunit